ncbi:hypothetical protein [Nocardia carnea]|uniref:hypothetical protein n=1 Tax=Nocardia carnea TaxID=37328 RepID=UPI0024551470|nr:hypothetical protein [Nocardia carnea]
MTVPRIDVANEVAQMAREYRADVELALAVPVIGDSVVPYMTGPDTDPATLRAADAMTVLPHDPVAAAEEIGRRREECGFSYVVFAADSADGLAPVVTELTGR